ncbi:hypothetical protein [Streptomyces sp. NPDC054797]
MLTVIDQVRPWFRWVLGVPVPFALAYAPSWGWIVAANVLLSAEAPGRCPDSPGSFCALRRARYRRGG